VNINNSIQKIILELSFTGINQSNNYLFDKASNLSNNSLIPILSEFFDDSSFQNLYYEFNQVELDLGNIPYENFEVIFIQRFKEALKLKFKDILNNNNLEGKAEYTLKNNYQNIHEILKYFLINGRLPWWATKLINTNIISVFNDFVLEYPDQFKNLLLEIGKEDNVRKRVAYSLPEYVIKNIVTVLQPSEFEYIFAYRESVLNINEEQKIIAEPESSLSKSIWYNIISYLITKRSSFFERKEFLKRNLLSTASFYNIEYVKLLELLYKATFNLNSNINNEFYNFNKDIQTIFVDEVQNYTSSSISGLSIFNKNSKSVSQSSSSLANSIVKFEEDLQPISYINEVLNEVDSNSNSIKKYDFDEHIYELLLIVNYYLINGSLYYKSETYSINDLKNAFQELYTIDSAIISKLLLNLSFDNQTSGRIYSLLNKINYKFVIDTIVFNYLNISINDIHQSFIKLLITQNRSTSIYLTDDWKKELLYLVYNLKESLTLKDLFSIYLIKYAKIINIDLQAGALIYLKELKFQNNSFLINKFTEIQDFSIPDTYINSTETNSTESDSSETYSTETYLKISKDKGLFDLLRFIIDFGFIPWWGVKYIDNGIQKIILEQFEFESKEFYLLLRYASKNTKSRIRYLNLMGETRVEFMLLSILKNENAKQLINLFKNIFTDGITYVFIKPLNNIQFIEILWESLNEKSFNYFDEKHFLKKIIIYYSNHLNISQNRIAIKFILNYNLKYSNDLVDKYNSIISLYLNSGTRYNYSNSILKFQNSIKSILHVDNYSSGVFEQFVNLIILNDNQFSTNSIIYSVLDILNQLLLQGKIPKNLSKYLNINIEIFLFELINYLFSVNQLELEKLLSNYPNFKNEFKLYFIDLVFQNDNSSLNQFLALNILPYSHYNYEFLINTEFTPKNILGSKELNNLKSKYEIHYLLNIKNSNNQNQLYQQYESKLSSYLRFGLFEDVNKNEDEILKYLILSIYQKGLKTLLDIFKNTENNIFYVQKVLRLFDNAQNIQDRQIFYALSRTFSSFDYINESNASLESAKQIENISIDSNSSIANYNLKDLFLYLLNIEHLSSNDYLFHIINSLEYYLTNKDRIPLFVNLTSVQYQKYLRLLLVELAKISSSEINKLLTINNINQTNIFNLYQLFDTTNSDLELNIKNVFITYYANINKSRTEEPKLDSNKLQLFQNLTELFQSQTLLDKIDITLFFKEISNAILLFLKNNKRIEKLKHLTDDQFFYYLKLILIEITKKSPSDLNNLLSNSDNGLKNILILYEYFQYSTTGIELTVKNIFTDYFNTTLINKFHLYKLDLKTISSNELNKWINIILETKNYSELIPVLFSFPNHDVTDKIDSKSLFDEFFKNSSIINSSVLQIFFNLMRDSFQGNTDKIKFILFTNQWLLKNISINYTLIDLFTCVDDFILYLHKQSQYNNKNYLQIIIDYLPKIPIYQPIILVQLIDHAIVKGSEILENTNNLRKIESNIFQIDPYVKSQIDIIKKQTQEDELKIKKSLIQEKYILSQSDNAISIINQPIYINNIGLVLFHMFIPTLFSKLNLLSSDGEFIDEASQFRAVHILQLLVSGSSYEEHELVLNKILCNMPITDPIPMDIIFSDNEKNITLELVGVVIKRWDKMKNSSIEHFRAAFLMRDGRIILKEDGWYLTIEKRGYDIILGTLPWAFGVVKFKWMPKFLYTEWN
jgi:hypothetical protein